MTGYYQDPVPGGRERIVLRPLPATVPFWLKPVSIFGLVLITTLIESSRLFTLPSIQPHLRLMLADTPPPHSSGASQ
jgi:hypothetical protein